MSAKGRRCRDPPASDRASRARLSPFPPPLLTPATKASLLSSMTIMLTVK